MFEKGTTMEKKYVIAIAAVSGTAIAVGTGIFIKKTFFGAKEDAPKETKNVKTVKVDDTKKLSGVVHTMVAKMDSVKFDNDQMYELVSGVLFWAKKNGKDELTGDEVKQAANWVSNKHGWGIEF